MPLTAGSGLCNVVPMGIVTAPVVFNVTSCDALIVKPGVEPV